MFKNLDWKYIIITLVLIIASIVAYDYQENILSGITAFFEYPNLNIIAGTIATVITLVHKVKDRKIKFSPTMSFNEFRIPFEDMFSFVGSTISLVGSLAIAKGIYLQTTSNKMYFHFNNVELSFIGLVAIYMLYSSVMELLKNCKEIAILKKTSKQSIVAVPESQITEKVPDIG